MMGLNAPFPLSAIRDGTSSTVMLNELRVGPTANDIRGTWALGGPGASATAAHGFYGDASNPNPCNDNTDDMGPYCTSDMSTCMTCYTGNWGQAASRSEHVRMVHAAMGDGSVHGISDNIAANVWDAIHTSQGKEPIVRVD
jgi:hypothetical protein